MLKKVRVGLSINICANGCMDVRYKMYECLWLIERSRALGPGCAVSPRHRLMIRSRLIQCLFSKNNKTHVSTRHVTHVYTLVLTLVFVLLNQRPGWSPRTGAHLHHRRIPVERAKPRSVVPRRSAPGHRRQHEPEVHGDRRWHAGRGEPAVRGRWGDAERLWRRCSGGIR